jgi:tetratricopeptide (TPR) repeat protein
MAIDDRRHPDIARLAEYADGVLPSAARTDIERHLVGCEECRETVAEVTALDIPDPVDQRDRSWFGRVLPFRSRRLMKGVVAVLAAAAALVLVVRLERPEWLRDGFRFRSDRPELRELVAALANEPTRPVEGRLTGGFKYASPPSPTRGAGDGEMSPEILIAAATLERAERDHDTPANLAAAGVAYLAVKEYDKAVDALERAAARQPANAQFHSDLAAAYLARGSAGSRPDDWSKARAEAELAIAKQPDLLEAHFNRALAIARIDGGDRARAAWREVQQRETDAAWRREAERRGAADR